jgi:hypothetical protein
MAKQAKEQKKMEPIIHEFKIGKLIPYPSTKKVKTREQSIANALESARKVKKVKK